MLAIGVGPTLVGVALLVTTVGLALLVPDAGLVDGSEDVFFSSCSSSSSSSLSFSSCRHIEVHMNLAGQREEVGGNVWNRVYVLIPNLEALLEAGGLVLGVLGDGGV